MLKLLVYDRIKWHPEWYLYNIRPQPIMLKILPIMLLSKKFAHYAQYYAHEA